MNHRGWLMDTALRVKSLTPFLSLKKNPFKVCFLLLVTSSFFYARRRVPYIGGLFVVRLSSGCLQFPVMSSFVVRCRHIRG